MKKIVLLDGNAIMHRAFHALPPLTSPDGQPTNAVYGFVTILLKIIDELQPEYIAATFDMAGPTFRHVAYERYKATRVKAPDELYAQLPTIKAILGVLSIPVYEKQGFEADDVIGTLARILERHKPSMETIIVTGDLDTLQLVSKKTKVYTMKKGISDTILYDEKAVFERYGFSPERVIDYKGLRGDPSDNIPGVRGIGEKGATELIQEFGTIENIYKNISKVKSESVRKKLEIQKEEALFSKELATINTRVPIDFSVPAVFQRQAIKKNAELKKIFQKLGFYSLVKRLELAKENEIMPQNEKQKKESGVLQQQWKEIKSEKDEKEFFQKAQKQKVAALGFFSEEGVLQGMGEYRLFLALSPEERYVLSSAGNHNSFLRAFCENEAIEKITFNGKKDALLFRSFEIFLKGILFDATLAEYLLMPSRESYDPARIIQEELGQKLEGQEECVSLLFALKETLLPKLEKNRLMRVFSEIELPLISFLVEMEHTGIAVDSALLQKISQEISVRIKKLEEDMHRLAGGAFNVNSPQQVRTVLFEKMGLLEKGMKKTAKGAQSTRESELQKLSGKHPIVDILLEHREFQKLKTTYADVLPTLVGRDGRIHTTFNQTGTVTGRLSSVNPNLQNIPIRTQLGKKIRTAFIPEKGYSFVSFDYSQIQLRLAAHMSGDKKMIEAFRRGVDIHALTAAEVEGVAIDAVTPEMRREAKTLNFGVLYGMGARAFAESAGIPHEKAKRFIEKYFNDFSGLRAFLDGLVEGARRNGYVETLFGRRRYIPELQSPYIRVRMEGERMAINMPIQGTDADIMKLAMNAIYKEILEKNPRTDIRPVLQIHDELVFEVTKGREEEFQHTIKKIMENIVALNVPVIVDSRSGHTWGGLQ